MICCFDLDGTLIDSSQRHSVLLERLLQQEGGAFLFDAEAYMAYKREGMNTKNYLTATLGIDEKKAKEICDKWIRHIEDNEYLDMDMLYPDALPALQMITAQGISVYYLTARQYPETLLRELSRLELDSFPQDIFVCSPKEVQRVKAQRLANLRASDPDTVYFADMETDYWAAKEAGITPIIMNRGFRSRKFLAEKGIPSVNSLLEGISCLNHCVCFG